MFLKLKNKKIIIATALLVVGIIVFIATRGDEDAWIKDASGNWVMHGSPAVHDFESCAAKYPVRETYPEQCAIPNGPTFTKQY